jgi:hypothetical protein
MKSFAWVAGGVVYEDPTKTHPGRRKIKSLGSSPTLGIKNLRDGMSRLMIDALRGSQFPIAMLKDEVIGPIPTYSDG